MSFVCGKDKEIADRIIECEEHGAEKKWTLGKE
jgi:hypothetical protein